MASTPRTITVTSKGGKYDYVDEGNKHGPDKHIHNGDTDTISWTSKSGDLEIYFSDLSLFCPPPPSPITAKEGFPTTPARFCPNPPKASYKYTVTIKNPKTHKPIATPDDPQIIFDDRDADTDLRLFDDSLTKLGPTAQAAFQGLLKDLQDKNTTGLKRDPNALFFPGGINNITVAVTAPLGITVSVTVSGSDPAALFNGHAEKK